jgi:hypothetical protein
VRNKFYFYLILYVYFVFFIFANIITGANDYYADHNVSIDFVDWGDYHPYPYPFLLFVSLFFNINYNDYFIVFFFF